MKFSRASENSCIWEAIAPCHSESWERTDWHSSAEEDLGVLVDSKLNINQQRAVSGKKVNSTKLPGDQVEGLSSSTQHSLGII